MRVLFAGPSLHGELALLAERHPTLDIRGPACCGDIAAAVDAGAEAIGLVDGCFGDHPAVWHKEILHALEACVPVGGGASMGALRAAECAALGMVGIGALFEDYASGRLLDDEAVAVAHGPAELGWMPLSVPWVNFEATVGAARRSGRIDRGEAERLMLAGRHLHFAERSFAAAVALCANPSDERAATIRRALSDAFVDRKRQDARSLVEWLLAVATPGPVPPWQLSRTSHWLALRAAGAPRTSALRPGAAGR